MDFDLFPLEIKFMILSHLTKNELSTKVRLVSKDWSDLAKSSYLRTEIKIKGSNLNMSAKTIRLLPKNKRIHTLKIITCYNLFWIDDLPICNNIRRVEFRGCDFGFDVYFLRKFVDHFPAIESISASDGKERDANAAVTLAVRCKNLKSLDLGHKWICTFEDSFFTIHSETLKKLSFNYYYLSEKQCQSLGLCFNLQELRLFNAVKMEDKDLNALKGLSQLRVLHITSANKLQNDGYVTFFSNVFPNLKSLIFESCRNINSAALKLVANGCRGLRKLHVTCCPDIWDIGVTKIIELCNNLQELNLRGCSKLQGGFIFEVPNKTPKMEYLNLQGCHKLKHLSHLMKLKTEMPKLKLILPMDSRF